MLPIIIDPAETRFALIGRGERMARRKELLAAAGVTDPILFDLTIEALPDNAALSEQLANVSVLFMAGLEAEEAAPLAGLARGIGLLVNTEDIRALCDFHVPATVRRGDLLLTASTGGQAPGLARRLRIHLESLFGKEWEGRLDSLANARQGWRDQGDDFAALAAKSNEYIDREGWFA